MAPPAPRMVIMQILAFKSLLEFHVVNIEADIDEIAFPQVPDAIHCRR
jgi:hypothetical protein